MATLRELGEKGLILELQKYIDTSGKYSSNEDAFFYQFQNNSLVINVDTMARKSDFLPNQTWTELGQKLVAITFSDLAAKGIHPEAFMSSLNLNPEMTFSHFQELISGIKSEVSSYGCVYIGGDLGAAKQEVLTGIAMGSSSQGMIGRDSANAGDLVCTTGSFGITGVGFDKILNQDLKLEIPVLLDQKIREKLYTPKARVKEGLFLHQHSLATAAIDSSDGLAISLNWLADLSKVKIIIEKLPIDPLLSKKLFPDEKVIEWTLYGGEEYELVFTVEKTKLHELKRIFKKNNFDLFVIGHCEEGAGVVAENGNETRKISFSGWDSYKKQTQ